MVIWNNLGLIIVSLVQKLPQAYQVVEAEAKAECKAMEFGREIGMEKVSGGRLRYGGEVMEFAISPF